MKLLQTLTNADACRTARIYRNGNWNEFVVQFYQNGKHLSAADYHDDDRESCKETAWSWCFEDQKVQGD